MTDMPRPRPPHLHRQVTRHGKTVWYVRIGKGLRVRIRAEFGSPEFDPEYQAAITGAARPQQVKGEAVGSLGWLIARYRETTAWAALSAATRRQRENIFLHVIETAGAKPFAKITPEIIMAGRERRASTPAQARNFLDAMRGLFRWAAEAKLVKHDPTLGVRNPPRKASDGFIPWTEEHVAKYQRRWPMGTRQRVWLDVLLYSGLRRGDAPSVRLVVPLAYRARHMASVRSLRRRPQTMAPRLHNSRRSLDGPAMRCPRSTPELRIANGSAERLATCWRTKIELLFPHLSAR
jgi:hypothetical protein